MAETLPEKVGSAVAAAQAEESGSAPATGAAGEDAGLGDQYTEPFPPPPPEVKEMAMEQERGSPLPMLLLVDRYLLLAKCSYVAAAAA